MANVSRVNGLRPVKHLSGSPWMGNLETFSAASGDATPIGIGSIVKSSGTANADGVQTVARLAANTDLPVGVLVGVVPVYTNLNSPQYRAASTAQLVQVCVDPTAVYEIQANAATVLADVGLNVGVAFTADSTTTGLSSMQADMATKATTSTLPLKIVGVVQRPDQDMSDSSNWKLLVTLNSNNFGSGGTTGA